MSQASAGPSRSDADARRLAIERELLGYAAASSLPPLPEPSAFLFDAIKDILLLATDRSDGASRQSARDKSVREAACLFVRLRLLHPAADHYALLGLRPGADRAQVKDRYRLMMRLLHPDFATAASSALWPQDAAARVNRAYEVLASATLRQAYDRQRGPAPGPATPAAPRVAPVQLRAAAARAPAEDPRQRLKRLALLFGAGGALTLSAVLLVAFPDNKDNLVQRIASNTGLAAPGAAGLELQPLDMPLLDAPATQREPDRPASPAADFLAQALTPAMSVAMAPPPRDTERVETAAAPLPRILMASAAAPVPAAVLPAPMPVAAQAPTLPAVPPASSAAAANPAASSGLSGPTLARAHPLLAQLLQLMEGGSGDRLLNLLDHESRKAPAAQALVRHYDGLVGGARAVAITNAQFKADPRDGALLVNGDVGLRYEAPAGGAQQERQLAIQAEFALRDGQVVMTRLARGPY